MELYTITLLYRRQFRRASLVENLKESPERQSGSTNLA